ncbi:hypothetical protein FQN53_000955 [Emmonsiellopsis sp. PD_33]|nr:hypothetical protein FQN53_000955 [Emmonsiellopsis sp. PD_33]
MAALHSALRSLGPIAFDDIPSDPRERRSAVHNLLSEACLLVESVPDPPPLLPSSNNGASNNSDSSTGSRTVVTASNARPPVPISAEVSALQREWGKPVNKVAKSKDNPLQIPVYKLGSRDGRGAWFARRSIHGGLPFDTWRAKLKGEFEETLKLREREENWMDALEKGKIRGLGCERKLEMMEVWEGGEDDETRGERGDIGDDNKDGNKQRPREIGLLEVYHLSARFPGPAAPRDFVTLLLTSDVALDIGRSSSRAVEDTAGRSPRNYMVISKPCKHPEAPPRQGYIRGDYESVEFIRELPSADGGYDGGICPVEWIMITRSDPGGSVPRWMVERGTPPSIVADAMKFVDWASREDSKDQVEKAGDENEKPDIRLPTRSFDKLVSAGSDSGSGDENDRLLQKEDLTDKRQAPERQYDHIGDSDSDELDRDSTAHTNGLFTSVASVVSNKLGKYAPQGVLDYIPGHSRSSSYQWLPQTTPFLKHRDSDLERQNATDEDDDSSSISSSGTFASADSRISSSQGRRNETDATSLLGHTATTAPEDVLSRPQSTTQSIASSVSATVNPSASLQHPKASKKLSKLAKLASRKQEAENKLAAIQAESSSLKQDVENQSAPVLSSSIPNGSDGEQQRVPRGIIPTTAARTRSLSLDNDGNRKDTDIDSNNLRLAMTTTTSKSLRKRAATLSRTESKLKSRLQKIGADEKKLLGKIESRRRKDSESDQMARAKGEIEALKSEVNRLNGVVRELRGEREAWIELVGRLQKENTALVAGREGVD